MANFFRSLIHLAFHAGAFGLLVVGALDSSFLMLPMGNDLLLMALSAHYHLRTPWYVLAATAGSVLGTWVTIWLSQKGQKGLQHKVGRKRIKYIQDQIGRHAAWAISLAGLMPPPFPFTAFVAAAGALKYPKGKLLFIVACSRLARFSLEGALAVHYGKWILSALNSPKTKHVMIALVLISIVGSGYSLYNWYRRSPKIAGRVKAAA